MEFYGIRGVCNKWFASYLADRKHYLEFNNYNSEQVNITCGVPQGSILGPLLFSIYINDINRCTKLNLLSFADDTTVYKSGIFNDDIFLLINRELTNLYDWFCANKLSLNSKKTNYIIFNASNTNLTPCNIHLVINNERIHLVGKENKDEGVKFMGLYLDKHITWKTNINSVCSKMARSIYMINIYIIT